MPTPPGCAAEAQMKDVQGMTVDEATALHAERDGKTFYFCSDHYQQKFLSTPAGAKPGESLEAAVDNIRTL